MIKKLKGLINSIGPSVTLGLILTFLITYSAIKFYSDRDKKESISGHQSAPLKLLNIMDQKSIDLRLQSRGPRKGSDRVALLTVDERAVTEVGRWPWPRDRIAKAVENAIKWGAKVIAMDIVWSEPSDRPEARLAEKLKNHISLEPNEQKSIEETLNSMDADLKFSKMIKENAEHIVMGSFFENPRDFEQILEICLNMVYENSDAFSIWDNESILLSVIDPYEIYVPEGLKLVYAQHFKTIAEEHREKNPAPKNRNEDAAIKREIHNKQQKYCWESWLNPNSDRTFSEISDYWKELTADEDPDDFKFKTFQSWIDHVSLNYKPNRVPGTVDWVLNTPLISSNVMHTGFFNAVLDDDGTIRKSRLLVRSGSHYMPSIAFKAFLVANNYNAEVTINKNAGINNKGVKTIKVTNNETGEVVFTIPVTRKGEISINYAGARNMFPYVSLADMLSDSPTMKIQETVFDKDERAWKTVYDKEVKKSEFMKDKIFIMGATAIGIFDLRVTPFDENYPGAETHVNVVDNLLRQDFLYNHPEEELKMIVFILVLGLSLSLIMSKLGSVSGLITTVGLMAGIMIIDRMFFFGNGIVISIIFPLLLVGAIYLALTFFKYFTEERNKKELRSTFSKYVSPAIVDEILEDPSNIELGGTKKDISVFFSDIRGFTTISEKLDPKALSDLLNSYLTPMTDIVFDNNGTLDKYMGDAVMAFFGAPIHRENHPADACRAALDSLEKLKELQAQYKEQGLPMIDIGIGINTGECSVGNMGSETVRNYTVMGDAVNLGSRLEGINKQYGTRIIVSEFTYERVKDQFILREIDKVKVKGKLLPVKIYELVAEEKVPSVVQNHLDLFEAAYRLYHEKKFQEASDKFAEALNANPADKCCKLYIDRCTAYLETPPPEDWDGSYTMTTK